MMLLTTALAACAAALTPQSTPGATPTAQSMGGAMVSPYAPPTSANLINGRLLELTLNVPGQTWQERFVVGIPSNLQTPAPVLTLFHGYGEDPRDTVQRTALTNEALSRGWLVFAPLGAHHFNYGIDYSQENIEFAFEFIGSRLPLDMDRIYGVGFSMGGGVAASYAARHLDPNGIRFAAIINHTGTTSLEMTYGTSNDEALFQSPLMFGGTPDQVPFAFRRSSTVNVDSITLETDQDGEMATNLSHVPVQNWFALYDVNQTIIQQTEALHDRLGALGGTTSEHPVQASVHQWDTLDAQAAIAWLEQQTLTPPAPGEVVRTLADRDGNWHALSIEQRNAGDFTPVLWSGQPSVNALYMVDMKNVGAIGTDVRDHGLDNGQIMHVMTQVLDGAAPELRIEGLSAAPANVTYRGLATPSWSYDAQTGVLTLQEQGATQWGHWIIVP